MSANVLPFHDQDPAGFYTCAPSSNARATCTTKPDRSEHQYRDLSIQKQSCVQHLSSLNLKKRSGRFLVSLVGPERDLFVVDMSQSDIVVVVEVMSHAVVGSCLKVHVVSVGVVS